MPRLTCPHCEDEIDQLETRGYVQEYGYYGLLVRDGHPDTGEWEHSEFADGGDIDQTFCPSCGDELDVSDVRVEDDGEDDAEGLADRHRAEVRQIATTFRAQLATEGDGALADFDFCAGCRELKAKAELKDGKCERCRSEIL
jgi:hypothetical protein